VTKPKDNVTKSKPKQKSKYAATEKMVKAWRAVYKALNKEHARLRELSRALDEEKQLVDSHIIDIERVLDKNEFEDPAVVDGATPGFLR
jgi:DNA/RNA-binding domain of Phe-tRNA-synthetase-like protein